MDCLVVTEQLTHWLPPAERCRSETEKFILENVFSSVLSKLKQNITPLET